MSGNNKVLADIHEITFALACKYNGNISMNSSYQVTFGETVVGKEEDRKRVNEMINDLNQAFVNAGRGKKTLTKFKQAIKSAQDLIEHLNNTTTEDNSWKGKLPYNTFWNEPLTVSDAYWTNTGSRFTAATGMTAHNNNPSDVVVAIPRVDGQGNPLPPKHLGISLKATFGKADVGMYNGGLETFLKRTVHGRDVEDVSHIESILDNKLNTFPDLGNTSIEYLTRLRNRLSTTTQIPEPFSSSLSQIILQEIGKIQDGPSRGEDDQYLTSYNLINDNSYEQYFRGSYVFFQNCIDFGYTNGEIGGNNPSLAEMDFMGLLNHATRATQPIKKLVYKYLVPDTTKGFINDPFNTEKHIGPRAAPFTGILFEEMKLLTFELLRNQIFDDFALQLNKNINHGPDPQQRFDAQVLIGYEGDDDVKQDNTRSIELYVNNDYLLKVLAGIHQQTHAQAQGNSRETETVPYVKVVSIIDKGNKTLFKIPDLQKFLAQGQTYTAVRLETNGVCSLILSTNGVKRFIIRVKCESVPPTSIKIDIKPCAGSKQVGSGLKGGAFRVAENDIDTYMVDENDIDTYIKFLTKGDLGLQEGKMEFFASINDHCKEITQDIIKEIEPSLPIHYTRSVTKLQEDINNLWIKLSSRTLGNLQTLDDNDIDLINEYFYKVQDEDEDEDMMFGGGGKTRKRRNSVKKRKHKKKKQSSKKKQKGKKPRTRKNN